MEERKNYHSALRFEVSPDSGIDITDPRKQAQDMFSENNKNVSREYI